ncbi:MAG: DUF4349 domain-containing protein [Bacteroidales bacterium]|nr:DUF4349 domain-containing protein [Bacteroidales bacterium]
MKNISRILTVLTILTIYSCGQKQEYKGASTDLAIQESPQTNQKPAEKIEGVVDRKIIKEGEISFETTNINETNSLISKTVQELNGYISKDNVNDYSDRLEHRIVIRVPSQHFDLLLKTISESADKLDSKNIDVLDVTAEYIDIDARIKTKKELEDRYKELLKQATKVDEILTIEKEIGQLRTEIESVEGQMKYLKDRISFSTLTATYYQKTTSAFRFTTKFGQAIKGGWDGFLWFLIGLTHLWTFILIGLVTVYLIIRRRRNKKKNAT